MGVESDIVFVGNEDDGITLLVEALEEAHDFIAGGGIEVAGGFVGEEDGGVVDEGASDGDALALAAGELRERGGGGGAGVAVLPRAIWMAGDGGDGDHLRGGGGGEAVFGEA